MAEEGFDVARINGGIGLAAWDGRRAILAPEIRMAGQDFAPQGAWRSEPLVGAMPLPTRALPYESTAKLVSELQSFFSLHPGLTADAIVLLISFVLASWFSELAEICPPLSVISPGYHDGAVLLTMLHCVCRHPLELAEATERTIRCLPYDLFPTVLLRQAKPNASVQRSLRAMARSELLVHRDGKARDIAAPLIVLSDEALNSPLTTLEITLIPSRADTVSRETMYGAADQFQAQLLRYRLENFAAVKNAVFDLPELNSPYSELARTMGAAIVNHDKFRSQMFDVLKRKSGDASARDTNSELSLAAETLLALAHEQGRTEVYVREVRSCVNALLKARGETIELKDRAVGELIRKLGLDTDTLGAAGRGLSLTRTVRRQIHELARVRQVPAASDGVARCQFCTEARAAATEASK